MLKSHFNLFSNHIVRGILVILVAGLFTAENVQAAALINGGSFESPAVTTGTYLTVVEPTGWTNTFGDGLVAMYKPGATDPFFGQTTGNQAVVININDRITAADSGIVMSEGIEVTLFFDAAWFGNETFDGRFRVYHPDGAGGTTWTAFDLNARPDGMSTHSLAYTPTATDDGLVLNPGFLPLSGTDAVILDNVRFETIPEPASVLLLTFGGIALLTRGKFAGRN